MGTYGGSCEQSEHCNHRTKISVKKNLKKYFYALTIKLNTAPWKHGGTVSGEDVFSIVNMVIRSTGYKNNYHSYPLPSHSAWELDSKCQLHLHTLVETERAIYRKRIQQEIKQDPRYKNYSVYIQPLELSEVDFWQRYCSKSRDMREIYYRLQLFYQNSEIIEDFSELADLDIEYDSANRHFIYVDTSKAKLW